MSFWVWVVGWLKCTETDLSKVVEVKYRAKTVGETCGSLRVTVSIDLGCDRTSMNDVASSKLEKQFSSSKWRNF